MKTLTLSLLCTVFALSTAKPWFGKLNGRFDDMGYFHKSVEEKLEHQASTVARVQQKSGREICQSATFSHLGLTTYVHVCESGLDSQDKKKYCFVSDGQQCCLPPSMNFPPTPLEEFKLSDQFSTSVNFYPAGGSRGVCYDINNEAIEICSGCRPGFCVEPRCLQNTLIGNLDSCSTDACVCKVGFAPPDCCECDLTGVHGKPHYLDPVTNQCTPFCRSNCPQPTITGCAQCTGGFKPRDCCQCDDGFFDNQGSCKPPRCELNVDKCVNGECTCKVGYLPQNCCDCAPGYYKDEEDGKCKLPKCKSNLKAPCVNGECTCKDGYLPQDCCECAPGYYRDENHKCIPPRCELDVDKCVNGECTCKVGYLPQDCCDCAYGYYKDKEDGKCKLPKCQYNLKAQCVNGKCTCKDGYLPQDCCKCAPGYYKDEEDGKCKLPKCKSNLKAPCVNGECTCKDGYLPQDCCECAPGYYRDENHKCIPPRCELDVDKCVNGECRCKVGYLPQDCCDCAYGYYKDKEDGKCKLPKCQYNLKAHCVDGKCTCKDGYLPQDCCECAYGYYKDKEDGKCKLPKCQSNLKAPCVNGKCTCKDGYLPQDCCECAPGYYKDEEDGKCKLPECRSNQKAQRFNGECTCKSAVYFDLDCSPTCDNVERCVHGVCTCEKTFLPPDCCDCEKDLYKASDGTCFTPCVNNIVSCTRGVCTCKGTFSGANCCTESCTSAQDVYLLIDATGSYNSADFCRTHYSTQLMISALNPGSSLNAGTRLGVVMYPTVKNLKGEKKRIEQLRDEPRVSDNLFNIGTGCTKSVGKFNNLIDGFMNGHYAYPDSPYLNYTRSLLTYPATAFELLNKKIKESIHNRDEKDRRRVVIVITDGANDASGDTAAQNTTNPQLADQIEKLRKIDENINIIAAGNNGKLKDAQEQGQFMVDLKTIAGDVNNVVIDSDPLELFRKLIQKMIDLNTFCQTDGDEILKNLQDTNLVNSFCYCMFARDSLSPARSLCQAYCKDKTYQECRAPPTCPGGPPGVKNPWYVGSKNYNKYGDSVVSQNTKNEFEEDILVAVEEILKERMSN